MKEENRVEMKLGKENLILETGRLAKQASGSVTVQYGGTVVLVSACISSDIREGVDFFPLTVEYQEKTYAAGKIPGGFFKREGRPSENEILTARLIDRPIRPLFPKGVLNDIQVMAIVLSSDGENDPDVLAVNAASAALMISEIPFNGPVAACRVGRVENDFIINPTYNELENSNLDIVIAVTRQGVIMLESKLKEVSEEVFIEAIKFGYNKLQDVLSFQEEFAKKIAKAKSDIDYKKIDEDLLKKVRGLSEKRLEEICKLSGKEEREEAINLLSKELEEKLVSEGHLSSDIKTALIELEKQQIRSFILDKNMRLDGRNPADIRPINCEVKVLPRTHGSSLFTRGQTQSLAVTTLGTGEDEQLIEALDGEKYKTFMLHYSFPPFSVGETKPVRGPGRREIGHGALAERALLAVMPKKEDFPYTIRVVSEILESNGSSSMATVCAATLSLMDAGVPIRQAVAGLALGLIKEEDKNIILSDITGIEDHFGDMDFKVAGSANGMTVVQLDLKINGIGVDLLEECLARAKQGRSFILDKMSRVLAKPREALSDYAPRIEIIKINPEKIGELIGPGGKNIKKIINTTGAAVDIQDDGSVLVSSTDPKISERAIAMIKSFTDEVEVGRVYTGKVKRVTSFGAFCEIAPNKEGLVHISELSNQFVKNVEDVVKVGDEIKVKVVGIDELGRVNLSRKQVPEEKSEEETQEK